MLALLYMQQIHLELDVKQRGCVWSEARFMPLKQKKKKSLKTALVFYLRTGHTFLQWSKVILETSFLFSLYETQQHLER